MEKEIDLFSRTLDESHFHTAEHILGELKKGGYKGKLPPVHTWELYDTSFTFPRVRRYDLVEHEMNTLEHFQDNLNVNISNSRLLHKFIHHAKLVRSSFNAKYHDGEFKDPANENPWEEKE